MTVKGIAARQTPGRGLYSTEKFFIFIRSLRNWFWQRLILRCQSYIAGKSANRQSIEKCVRNAFLIDITAADFQLADKSLADALSCKSDMRMRLIGDCHTSAVAELEM